MTTKPYEQDNVSIQGILCEHGQISHFLHVLGRLTGSTKVNSYQCVFFLYFSPWEGARRPWPLKIPTDSIMERVTGVYAAQGQFRKLSNDSE